MSSSHGGPVERSIMRYRPGRGAWVATVVLSLTAACATTRQEREVERSGFLGDYSQLEPGEEDEAALLYTAPGVDWARYTSVELDSVTIWADSDSLDLSLEERQALTDYLSSALHRELEKDYDMVDSPSTGTLRIRVAITDAEGADVVANAFASTIPQLRLLSTLTGAATGASVLVDQGGIEVEIQDAITGRRLAAAVDKRVGTKATRAAFGEWSHVEAAFDWWAERLRERLAQVAGRAEP
jgi:hypothetical protein